MIDEPPPTKLDRVSENENLNYPRPQPAFKIPAKFADAAEHWLVFSSFVQCFLDPMECAINALNSFGEIDKDRRFNRVVFSHTEESTVAEDEMEISDLKRMRRDSKESLALVSKLGKGVFGKLFDIQDFVGGTDDDEQK